MCVYTWVYDATPGVMHQRYTQGKSSYMYISSTLKSFFVKMHARTNTNVCTCVYSASYKHIGIPLMLAPCIDEAGDYIKLNIRI